MIKTKEDEIENKDKKIRHHFDEKNGEWYFSIVDVIANITKSTDPRNYWKVLKNRLKKTHNQLVTECNQLKMKSADGKFYLTDVANQDTTLEIIKIVSEENLLPFRLWFDKLDKKSSNIPNFHKNNHPIPSDENHTYPQSEDSETLDEEDAMLTIDGYIKDGHLFIKTFIAGVNTDSILISATCKEIIIKGERKTENTSSKNNTEKDYLHQELYWGKFSRTVDLPQEIEIDHGEINESYGFITMKFPIINKNRSKVLKIKSL